MEKYFWEKIKNFIHSLASKMQLQIDKEAFDQINHYLEYDEYEMAFEGLFIEVMKLKDVPDIDLLKSLEVGKSLGLDKETVFDADFWRKFENYVKRNE